MIRAGSQQASTTSGRRGLLDMLRPRRFAEASPLLAAVSYVILMMAGLIAVLPFLYILSTSLKESKLLFTYPPQWIPTHLYWGNFLHLLKETLFPRWMFNTLFVSAIVTAAKLLFDSMAGYAFAKMQFPAKEILFVVVIAMLMIPFATIMIPLYFLVQGSGMMNTYWALILPPLANPIGIFLMRSFIESLPSDLENAARLDGASEFGIYRLIILPLVKPALVVLAILTFSSQYQNFLWPLMAAQKADMYMVTVGIALQRGIQFIDYGVFSAGAVLAIVPITILFLLFQRQWVAASLAGALRQ